MPSIPIEKFLGVDNLNPEFNVPVNQLLQGINVDVDNLNRAKRRQGYISRVAGNFHSAWNDHLRVYTFCVQGLEIKRIKSDFTLETIVSGLSSSDAMSFIEIARDMIVYSNGIDIGQIVNGRSQSFTSPLQSYQSQPIPSKLLSWLNARLYMAVADVLWFTDAYTFNVDKRFGFFQFSSDITLLAAVRDGLYVSDREKTYFVKNDPPSKIEVFDYPAIQDTFQFTHTDLLGLEGIPKGLVIIWISAEGVNVGGNGGVAINVTREHYNVVDAVRGKGIIREENGTHRYVVNLFN
jgi:hypothetical protein